MEHHSTFTWLDRYLDSVNAENLHVATTLFVCMLLVVAAFYVFPKIKEAKSALIPEKGITIRNIFEVLIETIAGIASDVIGPHGRKYTPFLGTFFFLIFFANLIGSIPGFVPPTQVWTTGASMATISFLAFNYFGFSETGVVYLKHFTAPLSISGIKNVILWAATFVPFFAFQIMFSGIELISTCIRPVSLTIRLTLNMIVDHTLLEIFSGMAPWVAPIPIMLLGLFVCFMQAFIFTVLSTVYISLAVSHDH